MHAQIFPVVGVSPTVLEPQDVAATHVYKSNFKYIVGSQREPVALH
jgi:hypothetical protein